MNKNNLCIATISWARNEAEESLLTSALQHLAGFQIPVFITDGGSTPSFLSFLKSIPHFTVLQAAQKGVYAQAKTSLLAAYQTVTPYIFYTEPDKADFFQSSLRAFLEAVDEDDNSGVILASRSAEALQTFPEFQQTTEACINDCCAELTGLQTDFTYGPFLLRRDLVPYLDQLQQDVGWGWRPYLFCIAHRLGWNVKPWTGNFECPVSQRSDDTKERIYRMKQLEQNIRGMVASTEVAL